MSTRKKCGGLSGNARILPDDWHPRDERDARIEELEEDNERLKNTLKLSATARAMAAEHALVNARAEIRRLQMQYKGCFEEYSSATDRADTHWARIEILRKWSARWKKLAQWRGWPASRHERTRQDNERLQAALTTQEGELYEKFKVQILEPALKLCSGYQARIEQLEKARAGWEADALNYARSRECQQQMTERAEARIEAVLALHQQVHPDRDECLCGATWVDGSCRSLTIKVLQGEPIPQGREGRICKVAGCREPAYETSHFCPRHRGEVGPPTA